MRDVALVELGRLAQHGVPEGAAISRNTANFNAALKVVQGDHVFGDDNELARGAGGGLGGVDVHAQSVAKRHRQVAG